MQRRMLCVGINHFLRPGNDLNGCIPDCHAMQSVALTLGISADMLTDQAATKANIMGWLEGAVAQAKAGDLTYIGYAHSGHGTHYNKSDGGLGEAIVPYDLTEKNGDWDLSNLITEEELRGLVNQVPDTCIVEIWADTCFSGGLARGFGIDRTRFVHNPANTNQAFRMADPNSRLSVGLNPNIILWSAASADEEAADAYINDGSHGAMTWFWTKAFTKNPKDSRLDLLLQTKSGLRGGGYAQTAHLFAYNIKVQVPAGH